MTGTGRAITSTPLREQMEPNILPAMESGTMSPYLQTATTRQWGINVRNAPLRSLLWLVRQNSYISASQCIQAETQNNGCECKRVNHPVLDFRMALKSKKKCAWNRWQVWHSNTCEKTHSVTRKWNQHNYSHFTSKTSINPLWQVFIVLVWTFDYIIHYLSKLRNSSLQLNTSFKKDWLPWLRGITPEQLSRPFVSLSFTLTEHTHTVHAHMHVHSRAHTRTYASCWWLPHIEYYTISPLIGLAYSIIHWCWAEWLLQSNNRGVMSEARQVWWSQHFPLSSWPLLCSGGICRLPPDQQAFPLQ